MSSVPISVIVPCFNDNETVAETLRSIFASWPTQRVDVVAINDASKDDSLARIKAVACNWPMRIIDNPINKGKAASLNRAVSETAHDLILFLDADTLLTPEALRDMTARMGHNERVGAVSCPYSPVNRGFLPAMQAIEYSMLRLGQGAGNVTSALALWGGCLMVKRAAFAAVGGFSVNAITEDVDLAFKLNRGGWKVEQSFVFIRTHVPVTWRLWIRQKTRWTAGGFQCVFKYPKVWLRNPLQMFFVIAYAALTISALTRIMADTSLLGTACHFTELWADNIPFAAALRTTYMSHGADILVNLATNAGFSLFSLVYIVPTMTRMKDVVRIALIVPFSVGYFPVYLLVSLIGFGVWFFTLRRTTERTRAW